MCIVITLTRKKYFELAFGGSGSGCGFFDSEMVSGVVFGASLFFPVCVYTSLSAYHILYSLYVLYVYFF